MERIEYRRGYEPGALGWIVAEHGRYYSEQAGFGAFFEAKVARELGAFIDGYDERRDGLWVASAEGRPVGAVAIAGSREDPTRAELRWFIVKQALQGHGVGGGLIGHALDFCRDAGFARVGLWTFAGLDAARRLYERSGFALREARSGARWGREVEEQRFELELPGGGSE